jgi:hypothetical protein
VEHRTDARGTRPTVVHISCDFNGRLNVICLEIASPPTHPVLLSDSISRGICGVTVVLPWCYVLAPCALATVAALRFGPTTQRGSFCLVKHFVCVCVVRRLNIVIPFVVV